MKLSGCLDGILNSSRSVVTARSGVWEGICEIRVNLPKLRVKTVSKKIDKFPDSILTKVRAFWSEMVNFPGSCHENLRRFFLDGFGILKLFFYMDYYRLPTRFQGIYLTPPQTRDLAATTLLCNIATFFQILHLSRLDQIASLNTLRKCFTQSG